MAHHGEALRELGVEEAVVASLKADPATAGLTLRENALVVYALKLTKTPASVGSHDIAALRDAGLADGAIHDAAAVVAYFNFVNRIALGLGVELEAGG